MKRKNIQQRSPLEVEEILKSLEGMRRAKARPFMHTRILSRLREEDNFWSRLVGYFTKPAIAFACLLAVLVADVITVVNSDYGKYEREDVAGAASGATPDVLLTDNYILAVNDVNQ